MAVILPSPKNVFDKTSNLNFSLTQFVGDFNS